MNGKQVIKALEKEGWMLLRVSGSHHRLVKDGKKVSIPAWKREGSNLHFSHPKVPLCFGGPAMSRV